MKDTELFYSANLVWDAILQHCIEHQVKKISIRTYGLYVGNSDSSIFNMLRELEIVNILIGSDYNSDHYKLHLDRAKTLKRRFNHINVRMAPNDHTKCALLGDGTVMIGGVNLTLSTWPDYAFVYHDRKDLYKELKSDFILNWNRHDGYEIK